MRVYLESFGCTQNLGEARALEALARRAGHEILRTPAGAEVGVLVTCGVIGSTEARMIRRYRALAGRIPRVVVTGCLVPLRNGLFPPEYADRTTFLPIREQARLPELLGAGDLGGPGAPAPPAEPPAAGTAPTAEIVLAQGCTSHCAYCFSRLARGHLVSVPPFEVLDRVRAAARAGAREIRLSSLDTACWGLDRPGGPRLPELLGEVSGLPGAFQVRVGMMSPQSLRPFAEEYFRELRSERFFSFLHLPVQSGSDSVLAAMRRGYTSGEFKDLLRTARRAIPEIMLSTDLIVGYPTETDSDFEATLALLEEVAPEVLNVTRFSARPMTPAHRLPPLPPGTVNRRSRALAELRLRTSRRRLEAWIGREARGTVLEYGPHGSSVARLPNYLPVALPSRPPLGRRCTIRIDGARSNYLQGTVRGEPEVPEEDAPRPDGLRVVALRPPWRAAPPVPVRPSGALGS